MGEPILLLVLSLAGGGGGGGGGGGQESRAVFVDQRRLAHHRTLPRSSSTTRHVGAALGEYKNQRPQDWRLRPKPPAFSPQGATLPTAKAKLAFAAAWLERHLRHRGPPRPQQWPRKGTAFMVGRGLCPADQLLLPLVQQLRALGRQRRALLRPAPAGTKRFAETGGRDQGRGSSLPPALLNSAGEDALKPADPGRRTLPDSASGQPPVTKQEAQPSAPSLATEVGAAHKAACQCPGSKHAEVPVQEAEGQQGGFRVPTPRTEEAAWAASALTFLLVVLILAVLYTRLHQKCRRGPSLYWRTSSEEGHETVAAVLKHRLFSRHRRKKRLRQQTRQQWRLLSSSSSGDSSA